MPDHTELRVGPAGGLFGGLSVPGDKSVSHRSVMLGSLADGRVRVEGFGASADTLSTVEAFRAMGVPIERPDETTLLIDGVGLRGLRAPEGAIDVGNAGTLMRLLPGLLAGQQGTFTLDGDESIRRRPMGRVADPLAEMGVAIETTEGLPPVRITGAAHTQPISYRLPVASAQVKSCLLFAGLFAEHGVTTIEEPIPTRDHTERMLRRAGVPVDRRPGRVSISPVTRLDLDEIEVPGDFSSAAPFIAAGCVLAGSNLTIQGVGINPTRTGMLVVLERMGARVGLFGTPLGGRRAGRRHRGAAGRAGRDGGRARAGAVADRRAAADRAGRQLRAGDDGDPRRGRAAGQGERPHRHRGRCAARRRRARQGAGRRLRGDRRPDTGCGAAGSTPRATTGSRCWAPSPGSARSRAW